MPEVLVVCPTDRDRHAARSTDFAVRFVGQDLDVGGIDVGALLEALASVRAEGVVGTKDRSALLAALVAERQGLPGPSPRAVVSCQHKPTSRAIQERVAPDAMPLFALLDGEPPFPPPWWVKPVVGRLSQEARRIDGPGELAALSEQGRYRDEYADLAGLSAEDVRGFLVEELLMGDEVTLEGYVHLGAVTVIGVTDSVKYPGTSSFERFEYPSALPGARLRELGRLADTLVRAHGLDDCFFNIEFFVPVDSASKVVEVNARIASQFSPLVEAVHGRSTYDALFALACGRDPGWDDRAPNGVAISYVMRVFEDAVVQSVPEAEDGLEVLVRPGALLSEQGTNDAASYRLAIFTEWAETREAARRRCLERARSLRFALAAPTR